MSHKGKLAQLAASLWKYSGIFLAASGALHCIGLLVFGMDGLLEAKAYLDRHVFFVFVFWLFASGIVLIAFGHTLHYYIKNEHKPAPHFVGYYLFGMAAVGSFFAPLSGFWLFALQGVIIVLAHRQHRRHGTHDAHASHGAHGRQDQHGRHDAHGSHGRHGDKTH